MGQKSSHSKVKPLLFNCLPDTEEKNRSPYDNSCNKIDETSLSDLNLIKTKSNTSVGHVYKSISHIPDTSIMVTKAVQTDFSTENKEVQTSAKYGSEIILNEEASFFSSYNGMSLNMDDNCSLLYQKDKSGLCICEDLLPSYNKNSRLKEFSNRSMSMSQGFKGGMLNKNSSKKDYGGVLKIRKSLTAIEDIQESNYYSKPLITRSASMNKGRANLRKSTQREKNKDDVRSSINLAYGMNNDINVARTSESIKKDISEHSIEEKPIVNFETNEEDNLIRINDDRKISPSEFNDKIYNLDVDLKPIKERRGISIPDLGELPSPTNTCSQIAQAPIAVSDYSQLSTASDYDSMSDSSFSSSQSKICFTSSVRTTISTDGTKMVNEYLLIKNLGKGTYGKVKLCKNKLTNKFFAIKVINKSLLNKVCDSKGRPRKVEYSDKVMKEIAILKKIDHPNIVKLFEVIDDPRNEKLFMVFEYVESNPVLKLSSKYKASKQLFTEDQARKYFRDLISGLEYLHDNKIIHRDIKPENLLIDNNGTLKLTDFGVSHMLEDEDEFLYTSAGTPAFLSPEACQMGAYNGKSSDIWAAGVTLYVMLFNEVPFQGHGILDVYHSIIHNKPKFPSNASPSLIDLLERILDKNPKTRITIKEIKKHEWVTNSGALLFDKKNLAVHESITEEDIKTAISKGRELKMIDRFVIVSNMKRKLGARAKTARKNVLIKKSLLQEASDSEFSNISTPVISHINEVNVNNSHQQIVISENREKKTFLVSEKRFNNTELTPNYDIDIAQKIVIPITNTALISSKDVFSGNLLANKESKRKVLNQKKKQELLLDTLRVELQKDSAKYSSLFTNKT
jgi:serine/threonine protein kinase